MKPKMSLNLAFLLPQRNPPKLNLSLFSKDLFVWLQNWGLISEPQAYRQALS